MEPWSHFDVPALSVRLAGLKTFIEDPSSWSQHERLNAALKEQKELSSKVDTMTALKSDLDALVELIALGESEEALLPELERLEQRLEKLTAKPPGPDSLFLTMTAGNGGHEACSWVEMLLRMYYRYAKRKGLDVELMDSDPYEPSGLRSVVVAIRGAGAFNFFEPESGVHRLSRVSPYDQQDRRQTSRALVVVEPEVSRKEYMIRDNDLDITTCCGGGPGGQAINKIESTVMIKHLPTGIRVRCQAERSQEANRRLAMDILVAKLNSLKCQQDDLEKKKKRALLPKADFGTKSRSYVLSQRPEVVDHRTGKRTADVYSVLDGDLDLIL